MKKQLSKEAYKKRLNDIRNVRKEMTKRDIDSLHVKLQRGNSKTGANCYTVSLLPVIDCANCKQCSRDCYDVKSDMIYKTVKEDRARNSVIHEKDPRRFWREIGLQIQANFVEYLRLNVGGDLNDYDFYWVSALAENNPKCHILFFTKNYSGINKFLEKDSFPSNVHPIMSAWKGMEIDNPNQLPESHVLYENGETTAPEYGAYYCKGNCSECAYEGEGCWNLKKGESVIFKYH